MMMSSAARTFSSETGSLGVASSTDLRDLMSCSSAMPSSCKNSTLRPSVPGLGQAEGSGAQAGVGLLRCEPDNGAKVQRADERVREVVRRLAATEQRVLDHAKVGRCRRERRARQSACSRGMSFSGAGTRRTCSRGAASSMCRSQGASESIRAWRPPPCSRCSCPAVP